VNDLIKEHNRKFDLAMILIPLYKNLILCQSASGNHSFKVEEYERRKSPFRRPETAKSAGLTAG
jgi:hypothetical protein